MHITNTRTMHAKRSSFDKVYVSLLTCSPITRVLVRSDAGVTLFFEEDAISFIMALTNDGADFATAQVTVGDDKKDTYCFIIVQRICRYYVGNQFN